MTPEHRMSGPLAALTLVSLSLLTGTRSAAEARPTCHASTARADWQAGRVLTKRNELHPDDNTIIQLTGDHGYRFGEHGLWAKQTPFEEGTRVPSTAAAPGVKPGVCAGLVGQVDICPTLAGLAGRAIPQHVQGTALQPLLANPAMTGPTA